MPESNVITLITPTRNRPEAFALLTRWIKGQRWSGPIQWIVVNDGTAPYEYDPMCEVIERRGREGERHSLCMNVLEAIPRVRGEIVLFAEDDDWWHPDYIASIAHHADGVELWGSAPALYYNLRRRVGRVLTNSGHCSLGQTAIRASLLPWLASICRVGSPMIDLRLWRRFPKKELCRIYQNAAADGRPFHVSVKAMPGEPGIGIGHRELKGRRDPRLDLLRSLVGEDFPHYEPFTQVPA